MKRAVLAKVTIHCDDAHCSECDNVQYIPDIDKYRCTLFDELLDCRLGHLFRCLACINAEYSVNKSSTMEGSTNG